MNKCPRCELNYVKDGEELCKVCQNELSGKDDSENAMDIISSIVNVGAHRKSKRKKDEDEVEVDISKDLPIMDGYDMMDTDIPESDMFVNLDEEEEDLDDDFDEEE